MVSMTSQEYRFRFFFDFGSHSCLWSSDDSTRRCYGYPVPLDKLPISSGLICDLHALAAEFNTSLDWGNPGAPSPWSPDEAAAFYKRADVALERLKAELGPLFIVDPEHRTDTRA